MEDFVIIGAAFLPGLVPFGGGAGGEAGVDFAGTGDTEVVGEGSGRAVIGDAASGEDEDAVVKIQAVEAVGDGDNGAAGVAGEVVEKVDDFRGAAGVEAAGDFIAEEQGGVADPFHGETKAAFLPAGEDGDPVLAELVEADDVKGFVDGQIEGVTGESGAQADGVFDAFLHSEGIVGDAELGDVAELGSGEVAVFREVFSPPEEAAGGLVLEAGDDFEKGGLPAAGGADDGHEVAGGKGEADLIEEGDLVRTVVEGGRDEVGQVFDGEHGGKRFRSWELLFSVGGAETGAGAGHG